MTRKTKTITAAPLPIRDGVAPSYLWLPEGQWPDMLSFLVQRYPAVSEASWRERMARGDVVDGDGRLLNPASAYRRGMRIFYYRELEQETPIPFEEEVLFQDEHLVVADKPHFLPTIPTGRFVQETLLVRLKKKLNLPDLTPIHRLDRETAGVVIFSCKQSSRGAYQSMFQKRIIEKEYEALAAPLQGRTFPFTSQPHGRRRQILFDERGGGRTEFGNHHRRHRAARRPDLVPTVYAHGPQAPAARAPVLARQPDRQRRLLSGGAAVQGGRRVAAIEAAGALDLLHRSAQRRVALLHQPPPALSFDSKVRSSRIR